MIISKPSTELPALNLETFTTDPTSRFWSVSGTGYTFGASGVTLTCPTLNTTYSVTLENTNILLKKYLAFELSGTIGTYGSSIGGVNADTYLNNTLVSQLVITARPNGSILGNSTIFKSTPTDWRKESILTSEGYDDASITHDFGTYNLNLNSVSAIKINILFRTTNHDPGTRTYSMTNLRWI